jgi:alkylhydroperoxidase/carboxymuconolactone decarboxylase family protein YurZ
MRHIPLAGRLPSPTRDDLAAAARAVYDAIVQGPRADGGVPATVADIDGRLQGPFNAMVHASPAVGDAVQRLGAGIRYDSALPDRLRELAIVTVAALRRSEFEWLVHAPQASAAGVTDDILEAIARGDIGFFEHDDRLVHRAVTEMVDGRDLSQDTFEKLCLLLGVRGTVDLVMLVGYYDLLALSLRAFRVPLPEDADPAW